MNISDKTIKAWKDLMQYGDLKQIVSGYEGRRPISISTVSRTIAAKKGPEHIVKEIKKYYKKKAAEYLETKQI